MPARSVGPSFSRPRLLPGVLWTVDAKSGTAPPDELLGPQLGGRPRIEGDRVVTALDLATKSVQAHGRARAVVSHAPGIGLSVEQLEMPRRSGTG